MLVLTVLLLVAGASAEVTLTCPNGYAFFEDKCYEVTQISSSYNGASCSPAQISVMETPEEGQFVQNLLRQQNSTGISGALFGKPYQFQWSGNYTDWATDPAPEGRSGLCQMFSPEYDWKIDVVDCDQTGNYFLICEVKPVLKECFDFSCYSLTQQYTCKGLGEHYATITSEAENTVATTFITDALAKAKDEGIFNDYELTKNIKINGKDEIEEGKFVNEDTGEELTYFDWKPAVEGFYGPNFSAAQEPDNGSSKPGKRERNEDCIGYEPPELKWVDFDCDQIHLYNYLCEEDIDLL